MTPDAISPGVLRLPGQTILSLRGPDRLRFLNGQVTNDMRLARGGSCVQTAVLDAKGRLEAICHVREIDDAYILDAPPAVRESLAARLDRYLIADDVELADVTDDWHLVHVIGAPPPALPDTFAFAVDRLGPQGTDLLSRSEIRPRLPDLEPATVEDLRISHGVPGWPAELHPGIFPAEAGLDATAVSFDKGCYLGQEVVSRMKRAGKTNRHLVLVSAAGPIQAGMPLLHDREEAGTITSVSPIAGPGGTHKALAYRRRKFDGESSLLSEAGTVAILRRLS